MKARYEWLQHLPEDAVDTHGNIWVDGDHECQIRTSYPSSKQIVVVHDYDLHWVGLDLQRMRRSRFPRLLRAMGQEVAVDPSGESYSPSQHREPAMLAWQRYQIGNIVSLVRERLLNTEANIQVLSKNAALVTGDARMRRCCLPKKVIWSQEQCEHAVGQGLDIIENSGALEGVSAHTQNYVGRIRSMLKQGAINVRTYAPEPDDHRFAYMTNDPLECDVNIARYPISRLGMASVLVHEGVHAVDKADGLISRDEVSDVEMIELEERAYTTECEFVNAITGGRYVQAERRALIECQDVGAVMRWINDEASTLRFGVEAGMSRPRSKYEHEMRQLVRLYTTLLLQMSPKLRIADIPVASRQAILRKIYNMNIDL